MSIYTIDYKYNSSFTLDMFWAGYFHNIYEYIFYINNKGIISVNLRFTVVQIDNIFGVPSIIKKKTIKNLNIKNISNPIINSHKSDIIKTFNQLKITINYFRNIVLNELLEVALNPNRIKWIIDETQKKYWNNFNS